MLMEHQRKREKYYLYWKKFCKYTNYMIGTTINDYGGYYVCIEPKWGQQQKKNTKKAKQKLYVLSRIIIASQMADKMKRSVGGWF